MVDPSVLTRTPRPIPLGLVVQVLFGSGVSQIAWWFVVSGIVFILFFDADGVLGERAAFRGTLGVTEGTVIESRNTGITLNGGSVVETQYTFRLATGGLYYESSFATDTVLGPGTPVTIEYVPSDPGRSRIVGMRTSLGGESVLFLLFIPLLFASIAGGDLLWRRRTLRLLRNGTLTAGQLTEVQETGASVDGAPVQTLVFRFQDASGRKRSVTATTHDVERLQDTSHELIVYDPKNSSRAWVLDALPTQPRINVQGGLEATVRTAHPIFYLTAPAFALLFFGVYVMSLF